MGGKYLPYAFTRDFMRIRLWGLEPMPLIIMLICVLLGWFYLRLTIAGRENYAVGGNEEAARFSGIQVNRVKLRVYSMLGLACGIAGMVSLGRFGTASSSTANGYELTVIAAAVVGGASLMGGRGTAIGALLGTLIIAMIQNGILITGISSEYGQGITGAAIIIAAALDQFSEYLRKRRLSRTTAHG
jgi:ribose/xylose/arabinose/galactoside ABC-type transport system permease subunit